jgi:protein subunit release factor B
MQPTRVLLFTRIAAALMQNQRSQHKNKAQALQLLASRLEDAEKYDSLSRLGLFRALYSHVAWFTFRYAPQHLAFEPIPEMGQIVPRECMHI